MLCECFFFVFVEFARVAHSRHGGMWRFEYIVVYCVAWIGHRCLLFRSIANAAERGLHELGLVAILKVNFVTFYFY